MKLIVKGQLFPSIWNIAGSVRKLRNERRLVNLGAGAVTVPVYEVELPAGTHKDGLYFVTPEGTRLYFNPGDQYQIGYLASELDSDPMAARHFPIEAVSAAG